MSGLFGSLFSSSQSLGDAAAKAAKKKEALDLFAGSDKNVYSANETILFALVDKAEWESKDDVYKSPMTLYSAMPRHTILTTCFADRFVDARVRMETDSDAFWVMLKDDSSNEKTFKADAHLLIAVALKDYGLLFANFHSLAVVHATRFGYFLIDHSDVATMNLRLTNGLNKRQHAIAVFTPELAKRAACTPGGSYGDLLLLPSNREIRTALYAAVQENKVKLSGFQIAQQSAAAGVFEPLDGK